MFACRESALSFASFLNSLESVACMLLFLDMLLFFCRSNGSFLTHKNPNPCVFQVMPNTGAVFTSTSTSTDTNNPTSTLTNPSASESLTQTQDPSSSAAEIKAEELSETDKGVPVDMDLEQEQKENHQAIIEDEDDIHFDERLFVEAADIRNPNDDQLPESDEELEVAEQKPPVAEQGDEEDVQASTPKTSKIKISLTAATP